MTFTPLTYLRFANRLRRSVLLMAAAAVLASGSLLITTGRAAAAACAAPSADYGSSTSTIKLDNAAAYRIWSRILAPDSNNNSYLLEVDGTTCYTVGDAGITANTWTWVDYQGGGTGQKITQNLTAGSHTLKMIGREPGVRLGKVLLVSDTNCVPVDTGANCEVAGDTTPPVTSITAPAAGTVSGTVNVTADATDNVGVTKVEFYVNGGLAATDTTSPYSYSWNTTTAVNGTAALMVKAYDAAGNVTSDTRQVTIANGDNQAPTTPTNVTATADAYNKVTVKWNASTDNVGVKGYRVSRDGVTVGDVTTGTQYVDNSVLPTTTYSYQVIAYDAANNISGLSTVATVKTPAPSTVDTQAPSAPTNVKATAIGKDQVNVSWTASTDNVGVSAYDVYRMTGSITAAKVATVTTTSYGDTGLSANTRYTYYIIARDVAGNASAKSASANARTEREPKTKTGTLSGTVTFTKKQWWNRPLVMLEVDGHRRIHAVKSDGTYTINRIPAGKYTVKYGAFDARTQSVVVKIESDKTTVQDITLQQNTK